MPLISCLRRLPTAISRCKYLRGSSSARTLIKSLLIVLLLLPSSSCNGFTSPSSPKQRRYKYDNLILSSYGNKSANSREELWNMRYQELVEYKDEHGDALVPGKYPDNPQLGNWVSRQRYQYTKKQRGEPSPMTQERVDKMNEISFVWDANEARWEDMFRQLLEYRNEHGNTALVPKAYPDNPKLGNWVDRHRTEYKHKLFGMDSPLTDEREERLNEIGFVWEPLEEAWEEMLQQLMKYKEEHCDTLVPQSYPDNLQLGSWVNKQRQYKKNNKLAPGRVDKLNEIGFVWDPLEDSWSEMFQQIVEYKDQHGDTLVPVKYPDNRQLGMWVVKQRYRYNRKQSVDVTDERLDKLNEIGFVWDPLEDSWNEMFQQLKQYKDKHGDALVPAEYPNNRQLGIWVFNQRQSRKSNKLTPGRVDKLIEIGFVWDPFDDAWNEMFQQIVDYQDKHGDTLVPAKYPDNRQLGIWVVTQRYRYNRKQSGQASQMTDERLDKLNEIGFVWEPLEAAWQSKYIKLYSFYKRYGHTKIPMGEGEHKELYYWCMRQRYSKAKGHLKGHRYNDLKKIDFDFSFREITKRSSLIENMIIYELERNGHEFDMLNKAFFGLRFFPDGVIIQSESVIFVEIDEKYHSCRSSYPIKRELGRMNTLRKEAATQGYAQVIFVRIGTGNQRKVDESQVEFVSKHLHELKSNVQPNRYSVHYIDYPDDNHHVIASKRHFDEVKLLTSNQVTCEKSHPPKPLNASSSEV